MRSLRLPILAVVGVALLGAAPAVVASTGVSIDVGKIALSQVLEPGEEYRLPTFGVRNPGTEPTTYRVVVTYLDGQTAAAPAASWFSFDPGELTVGPGASTAVHTRLAVPPDAEPGEYAALIGPQIVSQGSGAQVGAAAAAKLTFTVAESSGAGAWLRTILRFLSQNPWILAAAGLLLLLIGVRFMKRRFTLSVARRA
ncbi:MAG TPA: hypothetical protein VJ850_09565 [Candidatus Limnocylindrales bacterium]|nr:hypothetical protein [Candidatus Limnocylindrales bacterium]